jgi:serine protease Do
VSGNTCPPKFLTIRTTDGQKYSISAKKITRVGLLDLATLEFHSKRRYSTASIGNSDRLSEGESLYVSGWADPSPQFSTRTYQLLIGNLSGRIEKPQDGYALVYTVNALPRPRAPHLPILHQCIQTIRPSKFHLI